MKETGRSGIAAVVGRANVGKSTLVNTMLGEKIAIVSPIAQTTRNVIRGILTETRGQLVLLDTPGVQRAEGSLGKRLNRKARGGLQGADAAMLVLDRTVPPRVEDEGWMRRLLFLAEPVICVLNKADRHRDFSAAYRERWRALAEEKACPKDAVWIAASAATGTGVPELVDVLFEHMPEGPHLFPPEMLTDYPRKLAVADCIREKLFRHLREELPHAVAVRVDAIEEAAGRWDVRATLLVNKPSQKPMVIGKKGRVLARVRKEAESEMSAAYERRVSIRLWVKVEKKWVDNFWILKQLDL